MNNKNVDINEVLNQSVAALVLAVESRKASGGWLVEIDIPARDGFEGYPAVYGEWPVKLGSDRIAHGFRCSDLAPHDLAGCVCFSAGGAGREVNALRASGHPEARMVPCAVFLQRRLVKVLELVESLRLN